MRKPAHLPTPERILAAAAEIFGKNNFKAATIRQIAQAADANVAAINYHFRDKEGLYAAVLENLFKDGFAKFPADMGLGPDASPEERLLAFIRSMLHRVNSHEGWGGMAGPGRLIIKEFLEPTPSFEPIIEKYIIPHRALLAAILADLLGSDPPEEILAPCIMSVIGQCIYYALGTPIIRRLTDYSLTSEENLERVATFIWQFSLGGIEKIKTNRGIAADA